MAQRRFHFRTETSAHSAAAPQVVYDVVANLRNHLVWSGERATDDSFKLLSIDAPNEPATVGTSFSSTGSNFNGTFNDRSVVSEATPPRSFVLTTDARLDRKHGRAWEVRFEHRYTIEPEDTGSRITYTETIQQLNYVPYWLRFFMRPISRRVINSADRKQLQNLARLAEEREP